MSEHSLGQSQPAEPAADEKTPLETTPLERTELLDRAISQSVLSVRHARGRRWQALFNAATLIGLVALTVLGLTVVNEAFGLDCGDHRQGPGGACWPPPGGTAGDGTGAPARRAHTQGAAARARAR
ncbi:MAG: hypothetical protein M5R40_06440 [Anaerolineae bacterium]|nr:hypothetical protein [Anaerolineae bacterium]